MLGVGVGFDTKGADTMNVVAPGSMKGLEVRGHPRAMNILLRLSRFFYCCYMKEEPPQSDQTTRVEQDSLARVKMNGWMIPCAVSNLHTPMMWPENHMANMCLMLMRQVCRELA